MEFRILGPLEVIASGAALPLGRAQQRAVLALLLICAPEPVSRGRLIDELWGERPTASAEHAVQVYVSGLRKLVRASDDEVVLRSSSAGYALEVDPERIDARRFERLVHEAQRAMMADAASAPDLFVEALGLWRGPPLAEFGDSEFARLEAERLEDLRTAAVEGLAEARLERGEHAEIIGQISALVAANPLRERPRGLLMLALYRSGRHAEALAVYRDTCQALDEIGLQPGPQLRQLEQAILRHDESLVAASPSDHAPVRTETAEHRTLERPTLGSETTNPTNLPINSRPLVGRAAELDRLNELLAGDSRLVTLVGTGGVGKTRLALAAARRLLGALDGGAFLVGLAAVTEPAAVLPTVAHALGVNDSRGDPVQLVAERVGNRPTLLILDNFEQILGAGPVVGELVAAVPTLRVIVTSQAPLRIRAETVVRVDALELDAAVDLFIELAAATAHPLVLHEIDRPAVAGICERVGRLPLAVELAAARMGVLTPDELLRRIQQSFSLLRASSRDTPERHRTVQATIEWTYAALTEPQRVLLRRMGVFAGPVPLVMVETIAEELDADPARIDALDALEGLIDFSLIHREGSGVHGPRFSMPQALREFAREKLAAAGEEDAICRLRAEHIADLSARTRIWFTAAAAEQAPLLAVEEELAPALEWAMDHDRELHRRLLAGLGMMLARRGRAREAGKHLTSALDGVRAPVTGLDAWLFTVRAAVLDEEGRPGEAREALEPAIAFARDHDDRTTLAVALIEAAWEHIDLEETNEAVATAEESLRLARAADQQRLVPKALFTLVQAIIFAGRLDEAEQLLDEAAAHVEEYPPDTPLAIATMRADIALERGDHAQALDLYATSLSLAERLGDVRQILHDAVSIVSLICLRGDGETALEADALLDEIARDAGYTAGYAGVAAARGAYREALHAMRESAGVAGTAAAQRAAAVQATDRVARIITLAGK